MMSKKIQISRMPIVVFIRIQRAGAVLPSRQMPEFNVGDSVLALNGGQLYLAKVFLLFKFSNMHW